MRSAIWIAISINLGLTTAGSAQSNIDPDHKFAWGENIGWTNWRDADATAQGVVVGENFLSGYIWAENVGWINVGNGPANKLTYTNSDGSDFGVNIGPDGDLDGYAWGENIGWVNYDTSTLGEDRARFDRSEMRCYGYVWGENAGWINLNDATHYVAALAIDPKIPTLSSWGMLVMLLFLLAAGTVVLRRRRAGLA